MSTFVAIVLGTSIGSFFIHGVEERGVEDRNGHAGRGQPGFLRPASKSHV
jgi:hypothetical protein